MVSLTGILRQTMPSKNASKIPFRFHDLRHKYAIDYLKTGGKIYTLQKLLGHASIKTTELYLTYLTPEEAKAAIE